MDLPKPLTIRYTLRLRDGRVEVFDIRLDPETLDLLGPVRGSSSPLPPSSLPPWTALAHQQCPNCPLDSETHPACPLAVSIVDLVKPFADVISYDEVDVEATTAQRTISTRTTSQIALRSVMGLLIACSGCPHTAFFKPMARFHLPFADGTETMFRAVSSWLVAQYFRHADGLEASFDLEGLRETYEAISVVNRYTARRLRVATRADASLNAVVLLDMFGQLVPHFIHSALAEVRGPFGSFLAQQDAAGSPDAAPGAP